MTIKRNTTVKEIIAIKQSETIKRNRGKMNATDKNNSYEFIFNRLNQWFPRCGLAA